jgi:cell division septal protein FtsQ
MRKKNRSFLLISLISASLLVGVFTIVQALSPAAPAAKATNWSDPATWPNRKVPVAGDKVIIEKDRRHSAGIEADAEGVAKPQQVF